MLDTDPILAISTAVIVASCCITVLVSSICHCTCNPRQDCNRICTDCKKDRENCRKCCARGCPRARADTEEELVP